MVARYEELYECWEGSCESVWRGWGEGWEARVVSSASRWLSLARKLADKLIDATPPEILFKQ